MYVRAGEVGTHQQNEDTRIDGGRLHDDLYDAPISDARIARAILLQVVVRPDDTPGYERWKCVMGEFNVMSIRKSELPNTYPRRVHSS